MGNTRYCLAWQSEAWQPELMPAPTAPANYKDQEKIDAYIVERKKIQAVKAVRQPAYGRITDWAIGKFTDGNSSLVRYGYGPYESGGTPGVLLADAITSLVGGDAETTLIYGINAHVGLRMAAVECLAAGDENRVPGAFMWSSQICVDPYDTAVGSMDPPLPLLELIKLICPGDDTAAAMAESPDITDQLETVRTIADKVCSYSLALDSQG